MKSLLDSLRKGFRSQKAKSLAGQSLDSGLSLAQAKYLDGFFTNLSKPSGPKSDLVSNFTSAKNFLPNTLKGGKQDAATIAAGLASYGLFNSTPIRYGGAASKPFLTSILNMGKAIDPVLGSTSLANNPRLLQGVSALHKPGAALLTAPMSWTAKGLDSALGTKLVALMQANPKTALLLAGGTGALAIPRLLRGASKGFSNMATSRRIKQLQKGIAPKKYKGIAQQYGLK